MAWIPGCKMPGGESRAHFRRVMRRRVGLATPPQGGKAGKNTSWCLRPAASGKTACLEHCQPEREGGSPPAPPGVSSWLEPCAGKLARTVLRGGAASNGRSLPDPTTSPPPPERLAAVAQSSSCRRHATSCDMTRPPRVSSRPHAGERSCRTLPPAWGLALPDKRAHGNPHAPHAHILIALDDRLHPAPTGHTVRRDYQNRSSWGSSDTGICNPGPRTSAFQRRAAV